MSNESIPTSSQKLDALSSETEPEQTLAEAFGGRTGKINSEGRFNYSYNAGKEFARLLVEKRDAARNVIIYFPALPRDYEQVRRFLSENGWAHRVGDPERFARMMQGSSQTVVAWDEGRVVGFGRTLCDGVSNGYLSMVAVAEDRRGQGIGRELIRRLMGDDPDITWTLRAGRGSEGFWRKMGFAASEIAMERTRCPSEGGR